MSVDSGMLVRLGHQADKWQLIILENLIESGWRIDDHGKVVYLPLGDSGDYCWSELASGKASDLNEVFLAQLKLGETIGVVLSWEESQVGGEFVMQTSGEISFRATMNRRCVEGSGVTDVSWYLTNVLSTIQRVAVSVVSWEWAESI